MALDMIMSRTSSLVMTGERYLRSTVTGSSPEIMRSFSTIEASDFSMRASPKMARRFPSMFDRPYLSPNVDMRG